MPATFVWLGSSGTDEKAGSRAGRVKDDALFTGSDKNGMIRNEYIVLEKLTW